jgi:hypothetical protein
MQTDILAVGGRSRLPGHEHLLAFGCGQQWQGGYGLLWSGDDALQDHLIMAQQPLLWFHRSGHREKREKLGRGGVDGGRQTEERSSGVQRRSGALAPPPHGDSVRDAARHVGRHAHRLGQGQRPVAPAGANAFPGPGRLRPAQDARPRRRQAKTRRRMARALAERHPCVCHRGALP